MQLKVKKRCNQALPIKIPVSKSTLNGNGYKTYNIVGFPVQTLSQLLG